MSASPTRCSVLAAEQGARPAATATRQSGFLLLEWPLPWPRDPLEVPELTRLRPHLATHDTRVQLVVGADQRSTTRQAIWYRQRPSPAPGYERVERAVSATRASLEIEALLAEAPPADPGPATVDVLICTHGRRDLCCGKSGTELHLAALASGLGRADGVRLWRTSHLGGHRFAPTALVLPDGTMWASADVSLLETVVSRIGHPVSALHRYRGTSTVSRPLQALEQHALAEVGWDWLRWSRTAGELADGRVRLAGRSPLGVGHEWGGRAVVDRRVPVPKCGLLPEDDDARETELVIKELRSWSLPTSAAGTTADEAR